MDKQTQKQTVVIAFINDMVVSVHRTEKGAHKALKELRDTNQFPFGMLYTEIFEVID